LPALAPSSHRAQLSDRARSADPFAANVWDPALVSVASDRYPESFRDKLTRGESYPTTRSEIDAVLLSHHVEHIDMIYFLRGGQRWAAGAGKVIDVHFKAADEYREHLHLRVFAVPTGLRPAVAAAIKPDALNDVAEWIRTAREPDTTWRSTHHRLTLWWAAGALCREESDGSRAGRH